jgi:hypothetical protein
MSAAATENADDHDSLTPDRLTTVLAEVCVSHPGFRAHPGV